MPVISIIAAIARNNCIGIDGDLPWDIPEDMAHFRTITRGKPVIMGRKTWESLPEQFRPLPGRTNIIISRQTNYPVPEGVLIFSDIKEAIDSQSEVEEIMIIGGAQIYTMGMPYADRLYITHVDRTVEGDTFFPEIDMGVWKVVEERTSNDLHFVTYDKYIFRIVCNNEVKNIEDKKLKKGVDYVDTIEGGGNFGIIFDGFVILTEFMFLSYLPSKLVDIGGKYIWDKYKLTKKQKKKKLSKGNKVWDFKVIIFYPEQRGFVVYYFSDNVRTQYDLLRQIKEIKYLKNPKFEVSDADGTLYLEMDFNESIYEWEKREQ